MIHHTKYLYNGDGKRVYVVNNGSLTGCLYDGNQVIAEFDNEARVTAQFIHGSGLGADVGSLVYKETLDDTVSRSYYYHNWRGDVIDVTGDDGVVSYRYDAFGNIVDQNVDFENDLLFSSKKFDFDTSLSYFGARYYNSETGRFISRDPMGYIDGPNQYFYCVNNPIGFIDPFGLCKRGFKERITNTVYNFKNITKEVFDGTAIAAGIGYKFDLKIGKVFGISAGFNDVEGYKISSVSSSGFEKYYDSGSEISVSSLGFEYSYDFEDKQDTYSVPTGFLDFGLENLNELSSSITIPINSKYNVYVPAPIPMVIPIPDPEGYAVQFKIQLNLNKLSKFKHLFKKRME